MARILNTSALALAAAIVWQAPAAAQLTAATPAWSPTQVEIVHKSWEYGNSKWASVDYNRSQDTISAHFVVKPESGPSVQLSAKLKPLPNGSGFYGDLLDSTNKPVGKVELVLGPSRALDVTATGVTGSYAGIVGRYWGTGNASDSLFRPYLGTWKANGYELSFTSRDGMMIGTLQRVVPNKLPEVVRNYAFSVMVSKSAERLGGGMSEGSGGGPGAATEIGFNADKSQVIVHSISATRGDISDAYKKATTSGTTPPPPVTAGMPEPRPGYTACGNAWCRVKIASASVFLAPGGASNTFYPVLSLTTRLHNVSAYNVGLNPTNGPIGSGVFRFVAASGAEFDHNKTLAGRGGSMGPMPKPSFANGWPQALPDMIQLPSGSETVVDYWIDAVPADADRLWLAAGAERFGAIEGADAKNALCLWFRKAAELKAQNALAEKLPFKAVPDYCGGSTGGSSDGGGAGSGPAGTDTGGTPSGDSGSGGAGPSGTGASGGASSGGSTGGTAAGGSAGGSGGGVGRVPTPAERGAADPSQDGDFRALFKFGVKLEIAEQRGDGAAYQVIAQVRNRTATPIYLTSGMMRVAITDGDGVSVDTGQFVRASGEPPQLFASTPVVQPGGVIRLRWILRPNDVEGISSVTFTEGTKAVTIPVGG